MRLAAILLLAAGPALAREGGPIRTGEHPGFTRVVMEVEPTTEWSLETRDGQAVVLFPGRAIAFGTAGVWDRIPRTRVASIAAGQGPEGARVTLGLGCDCRVSASFVGARLLAIDVIDRGAVVPAPPARETEAAREARETAIVASAEAALAEQIAHAARQGVVTLAAAPPDGPAAQAAAAPVPPEPAPRPPAPSPSSEAEFGAAEQALGRQIAAISVYDRDSAVLAELRAAAPPPEVCLADADLDLAAWSDGAGLAEEAARLRRRLVGEFDRPDPAALRALVRLHIRYGFGLEAMGELAAFPDADLADRELLADLARAVEGLPVSPNGPLAIAEACPGAHALWIAIGGAGPVWRDAAQFGAVEAAFADLPPDLRGLLGPRLAGDLLDAGRKDGAALIQTISIRPGQPLTPEQTLIAARLAAAEGKAPEAAASLRSLAESGAPTAPAALAALARIALADGLRLPEGLIADLAASAAAARGGPEELELRYLLVASLGARGALTAAAEEAERGAIALPPAATLLRRTAAEAVAAADPAEVGEAVYAEAAMAVGPWIDPGVSGDADRRAIALRLIALGLPNAAIDLLAPAILRGDAEALRLTSAAALALGRPDEAAAAVAGLGDPESVRLRAAALAEAGDPAAAAAALDAAGLADEAKAYAWLAGDWERAGATAADPARAAMAAYMASRGAPRTGPAPQGEALTPEAAFRLPPPSLARPSLGAARDLLASGAQVDDFIGGVLAEDAEP